MSKMSKSAAFGTIVCCSVAGTAFLAAPSCPAQRPVTGAQHQVTGQLGTSATSSLDATSGIFVASAVSLLLGAVASRRHGRVGLAPSPRGSTSAPRVRVRFSSLVTPEIQEKVRAKVYHEEDDAEARGVETGCWPEFDDLCRMRAGDFTVVTGVPGSGKSEWLLSLVLNLAEKHDWRFLVCAFEHKEEDLALQLLEKACEKSWRDLKDEIPEEEDFEKDKDVRFIQDHFTILRTCFEEMTIDKILDDAQVVADHREAAGQRLNGLVIDPYNYICKDSPASDQVSETNYASHMLSKVKRFAEKNRCHVWLVAHPTKPNGWGSNRPGLYDIAGSAHFFNKCDNGIIVHRHKESPNNQVDICVDKVRHAELGHQGEVTLFFDPERRLYHQ